MEDLNHSLCKVIQELTGRALESVTDLDRGHILADILHSIDADEFSAKDKSLNDWPTAKTRLETFLARKGLAEESLDFELDELSKGDPQAVISALLQILAIMGAFNPAAWAKVLAGVDYMARLNVSKFLDSMIADIKEEFRQALGRAKSGSSDSSDGIKNLLQKLERHENTIEAHEKQIATLRADLEKERADKQRLSRVVEEKDRELMEMQQIKAEALKLLESNYSGKRSEKPGEDLTKKVNRLNVEIDLLNEKLLEARSLLLDRENEIDKLKLMQAFLEEKKTELDEANEQLSYYKTLTDNLKKEQEIYDSKLKCFEYADKNITKLKDLLKEEKQSNITLRLKLTEAEQSVESLQRRLGTSEDKLVIIRKSRLNLSSPEIGESLVPAPYTRELEEENARLKEQVKNLLRVQNELEMKQFSDELREKETEIMQSRIKSLLIENEHLAQQKTREKERFAKSMASIEHPDFGAHELFDGKEEHESILLQHVNTGDFSWENKGLALRFMRDDVKSDNLDLLYTTIMSHAYRELLQQRVLVLNRNERTRDIFKPFSLNFLMLSSKE